MAEVLSDAFVSYVAGVLAAGSPCVVVLVPLTLFRFRGTDIGWPFVGFLVGFLITYTGFAILAAELLASSAQNGIRAGLGGILSVTGMLCLAGFVNPLNLPVVRNPFLVGGCFALLVSVNPCTLPFLGMLLSAHSGLQAFLSLFSFALGLVTPAVLFVCFGKLSLSVFKAQSQTLVWLNFFMNLALIITGVYLISQVTMFSLMDVLVAEGLVLSLIFLLSRTTLRWMSNFSFFFLAIVAMLPLLGFHWISHSQDLHDAFTNAAGSQKCPANENDPNSRPCMGCEMFSYMFAAAILLVCAKVFALRFFQRDEPGKSKSLVTSFVPVADQFALKLATQARRQNILTQLPL